MREMRALGRRVHEDWTLDSSSATRHSPSVTFWHSSWPHDGDEGQVWYLKCGAAGHWQVMRKGVGMADVTLTEALGFLPVDLYALAMTVHQEMRAHANRIMELWRARVDRFDKES